MRLVKAAKASPQAKFYNLSTAYKFKKTYRKYYPVELLSLVFQIAKVFYSSNFTYFTYSAKKFRPVEIDKAPGSSVQIYNADKSRDNVRNAQAHQNCVVLTPVKQFKCKINALFCFSEKNLIPILCAITLLL